MKYAPVIPDGRLPRKKPIRNPEFWIPAGVYPVLDSRFRGNDRYGAGMTAWVWIPRTGNDKSMSKLLTFFQLIKFEHTIFALPFAYLGLFLSEGKFPRLGVFLWTTLAMAAVRTTGMAANRLIDESIDQRNPRTEGRKRQIEYVTRPVLWSIAVFSTLAFIFTAYRLNSLCFALSPIPVLLVWIYPYLKRFTWLSHFWLGAILGTAPLAGWLAGRGTWAWEPLLLTLAVAAWVAGFDMFYALQDVEFDKRERLKSFPVRFGIGQTLITVRVLHLATVLALLAGGFLFRLGAWYFVAVTFAAGFIFWEHRLVKRFGLSRINEAFFNMNAWVSVVIFLGVALEMLARI